MIETQIELPDPLYRRLQEIADQHDCSLSDVMQKAAERFIERFPQPLQPDPEWEFPSLECDGDFLRDPASFNVEADSIAARGDS